MRQTFLLLLLVLACLCGPHYVDICYAFVESSQPDEGTDEGAENAVSSTSSPGVFLDETLVCHPWPKAPSPWNQ